MSDTKKLVGQRIKTLRKAKGLTQDQLAEQVGMDSRHISRLETGTHFPSIDSLEAIAKALGVQLKDFFDFPSNESPEELRAFLAEVVRTAPDAVIRELAQMVREFLLRKGWDRQL